MIIKLQRPDSQLLAPAFAIIVGIASAISFWWRRGSLWEDEIIAITHGLQPFPEFFVEILRNDIHPFFYFLFLKFWTLPNIGSDRWALASSLFGVLFSAAIIAYVTYRVYGKRAAWWATALFCVLPTFAWAAGNLRMYSLVSGFAVACWFANREFLRTGKWVWAIGLVALQLVHTYTHAIGFFFVAFFALAALLEQWGHADRQRLGFWFGAQIVSLLGMLPVVASALLRGTEPLPAPRLFSLLSYPHQIMTAWGTDYPVALDLGGFSFLIYLILGLRTKESRLTVLVIPCGALLTCILVSMAGKPMFKPPVFTANLVPFLAIGGAVGVSAIKGQSWRLMIMLYTTVASINTWLWAKDTHTPENYRPAAQYIVAHALPGDVVIVPNVSVYWGIMRYAVNPNWGRPLDVMPLQDNEAWTKLKTKLGSTWVMRLGLAPATDHVDHQQIHFVIGPTTTHLAGAQNRVWVVHRNRYMETVSLGAPVSVNTVAWFGDELSVTLALPDQRGKTLISNPRPVRLP